MHANFHVTCFVSHIEQYIEGAMPLFIIICNNFFAVSTNMPIPGQWHEQLFILYHVSDLYVYRADRSMYHALCYGTILYHVSDLYVYRADRSMYHALCYGTILYHVSDLYVYRADRSMYHALCYGTIMYLQATMTFEVVSTNLTFRGPFW